PAGTRSTALVVSGGRRAGGGPVWPVVGEFVDGRNACHFVSRVAIVADLCVQFADRQSHAEIVGSMTSQVKVEEYYGGRRLLFCTAEEYELTLSELTDENRVTVYLKGLNKFSDRQEFPFYIYVRRCADGQPLAASDFEYLEAFGSRKSTEGGRSTAVAEQSIPETLDPPESDAHRQGDLEVVVRSLDELKRVTEETKSQLAERIDAVTGAVLEAIRTARTEDVVTSEHAQAESEKMFGEFADRERELVDRARNFQSEVLLLRQTEKFLRDENAILRRKVESSHATVDELNASIKEVAADHGLSISRPHLELIEAITECDVHPTFFRCLKNVGPPVEFSRLPEAIKKAKNGTGDIKSVKMTGRKQFSELRCNLGRGKGTGRLFFMKKENRTVLLGFEDDHDRETTLIAEIADGLG
ncbi:MAG: hypothetical protein ABIV13_02225, partial [Fimbriimonadales bacterium]